jgi:hypothetical protein
MRSSHSLMPRSGAAWVATGDGCAPASPAAPSASTASRRRQHAVEAVRQELGRHACP